MNKAVFLLCLWIISSFILPSQATLPTSSIPYLPNQTAVSVNSTQVIPIVNVSSPSVERGNAIAILIGLQQKDNTSEFVEGVPFHLSLYDVGRNSTRSLINDTTISGLYNYTLETYFSPKPLFSGTYIANVTFELSDTQVVANATFEVVLDPDARVIFQPSYTTVDFIRVGENLTIDLKIENVGASNAFNISISLQSIDEPVGLIAQQFPIEIPFIPPEGIVIFNFTVAPPRFGIGRLSFLTSFSNAQGITKVGTTAISFRILPRLTGSFSPNTELFSGNVTTFNIKINNLENANLTISFTLTSDLISFFSDIDANRQTLFARATLSQSITGTVLKDGQATVTLRVVFYDMDGSDAVDILIITQTVSISTSPINVIINQNPATILLFINIFILIFLAGSLVILYFKPELRNRILRRFMAPSIPDYELDTQTVIVDGSNVAWESPTPEGKANLSNIDKAIESLRQAGFKEIIVIADAALRYQVADRNEFDKAAKKGKIHVMPAKVSADHFILRLAKERNAMVLSNDLFKEFRSEQDDIEEKRIPYTIFNGIVYLHPLGKKSKNTVKTELHK